MKKEFDFIVGYPSETSTPVADLNRMTKELEQNIFDKAILTVYPIRQVSFDNGAIIQYRRRFVIEKRPGYTWNDLYDVVNKIQAQPFDRIKNPGSSLLLGKLEVLADLITKETRDRLHKAYPGFNNEMLDTNSRVIIVPGAKYTKLNIGGSGKYMVENDTGNIFGIKAYGVIHRGHYYGTLDTINQYYWGDYTAYKKNPGYPLLIATINPLGNITIKYLESKYMQRIPRKFREYIDKYINEPEIQGYLKKALQYKLTRQETDYIFSIGSHKDSKYRHLYWLLFIYIHPYTKLAHITKGLYKRGVKVFDNPVPTTLPKEVLKEAETRNAKGGHFRARIIKVFQSLGYKSGFKSIPVYYYQIYDLNNNKSADYKTISEKTKNEWIKTLERLEKESVRINPVLTPSQSIYRVYLPNGDQWSITWSKITGEYKSGSPMLRVTSRYIDSQGYGISHMTRIDKMSLEELENYMYDLKKKGYKVEKY